MLFLLRKIRRKLLAQNKVTSYLFYAIGEILLVVVGILIAVQIDTAKDYAKARILEKKILAEIRSNLQADLLEIDSDLGIMDEINEACIDIVEFLDRNEAPNDRFQFLATNLRVTPHFSPNKSGFSLLLSKGLELVLNDSLRLNISTHYESLYPYYKRYEEERIRFNSQHVQPVLHKYFQMHQDLSKRFYMNFMISNEDYSTLKTDPDFIKIVNVKGLENGSVELRAQRVRESIIALIEQINRELKEN
ncbi:hypothetical protein SAMN05421640_0450 [Ekhidna lutea]|uniref:Uncharacterized protein n=1 Tax=Ekhidna lutea TaxID=447679 RepID=A0A239F247_EKHLU|nr:DUF6090 family protein [Ekhidna lutea]SNS50959.1 hypothetical protein SAMN05421640_0450 [Ekhidna lutea]